ncbi:MAG: hypothetical protein PHW75_00105 [Patescibacteria group bacterium]|nr:hypothetical protein [Patescibacteria group bacterium]
MNIGVDMDQVLADFSAAFDMFHDTEYGTDLVSNPRPEFYIRNIFNITEEEEIKRVRKFYDSKYFIEMKPFPDSIRNVKKLAKNNNLYLITSRPYFVKSETEDWLNRYYPSCFKEIILTNHYFGGKQKKSEVCLAHNISFMIEDMAHYANDCAENGIKTYLLKRPWNIREKIHSNVIRVKDWDEISSLLKTLN